jgi:hypothetical protein
VTKPTHFSLLSVEVATKTGAGGFGPLHMKMDPWTRLLFISFEENYKILKKGASSTLILKLNRFFK